MAQRLLLNSNQPESQEAHERPNTGSTVGAMRSRPSTAGDSLDDEIMLLHLFEMHDRNNSNTNLSDSSASWMSASPHPQNSSMYHWFTQSD